VRYEEVRRLARAENISEGTLRRAATRVGVVKTREGFGKGQRSQWKLPSTHATPATPATPATNSREDDVAGVRQDGRIEEEL
jgi:hypothetical protein